MLFCNSYQLATGIFYLIPMYTHTELAARLLQQVSLMIPTLYCLHSLNRLPFHIAATVRAVGMALPYAMLWTMVLMCAGVGSVVLVEL